MAGEDRTCWTQLLFWTSGGPSMKELATWVRSASLRLVQFCMWTLQMNNQALDQF